MLNLKEYADAPTLLADYLPWAWLSHVMVSAQETQRPLLTPGEVMQLPPDEELVMVSGARPLKAKKLRYFEDQNFTSRVLPPPVEPVLPERRGHDWQGVLARTEAVPLSSEPARSDEGGLQHSRAPSIDPPEKETPAREKAPDLPKEDGDLDAAAVKSLKPAQRALGMDRADGDFFPKF